MADSKVELPPRDSWITVAPGEELHIDADLLQKWNEQTRKYRYLRGNILGSCFAFEYSLVGFGVRRGVFSWFRCALAER